MTGFTLHPDDPPVFQTLAEDSPRPWLLTCDHASNRVPCRLGDLGLPEAERQRHIAWDPGAARLTQGVSAGLGAAAILHGYSRLVLDPNRFPDRDDFIPPLSDGTVVPVNAAVSAAEREARRRALFQPYHDRLGQLLALRDRPGRPALLVALHSFTPMFGGVARATEIGIMHEPGASDLGPRLLAALAGSGLRLGDNDPYHISRPPGYSLLTHGLTAGRPCVGVEVRQDLLATDQGMAHLTGVLIDALAAVLDDPDGAA